MTEWLADDLELLGWLSAWDNPPNSTDSSSSSSVKPPQRRHPLHQRQINTSRERQKQELLFLRKKVSELETQLDQLRHQRDAQLRPHFLDVQCTQLATTAPVWEKMAIRQFQARKRSEMQNTKLKKMMATQQRIADDLMRAFRVMEQRTRHATPAFSMPVCVDVEYPLSETDQLTRLDSLCDRWTSEIARYADWNALEYADLHVAEVNEHEAVVEVFHSSLLPFSVARVEEALWSLYHHGWGTDHQEQSVVLEAKVSDDLIVGTFAKTMTLDTCPGSVNGRSVTKRFHPTTTQTGFVTQCQSESQGFRTPLDGVTTLEESWVRLIDAKELGHTELTGTLTVIQRVHRERILNVQASKSVASSILDRIGTEINLIQQGLEAFLMCLSDRVKVENH